MRITNVRHFASWCITLTEVTWQQDGVAVATKGNPTLAVVVGASHRQAAFCLVNRQVAVRDKSGLGEGGQNYLL
jgi:hypothetical protein